MLIARLGQLIDQGIEEGETQFLIDRLHLPLFQQAIERCSLLIGKVIGGEVGHLQSQCLCYVVFPGCLGLTWKPIDQVYTEVGQSGLLTTIHGLFGLGSGVTAVEQAKVILMKTLDPHAETVERQRA